MSTLEPAGAGNGRILDGFNQIWNLGAGLAANPATNRTRLSLDSGAWPNLLRLNLTGPANASIGDPIPLAFYYQYGATTSALASVSICLDRDSNPYDGNETVVFQSALPGTGISNVYYSTLSLALNPAAVLPGTYSVFGRISDGTRTRYLYAPQKLVLGPSRQPPSLLAERVRAGQFQFTVSGFPGQTVVIQASTNLGQWASILTNTLVGTSLAVVDANSPFFPQRYYRAVLTQ